MVRLFLLAIFLNAVALGVVLDSPIVVKFDEITTSSQIDSSIQKYSSEQEDSTQKDSSSLKDSSTPTDSSSETDVHLRNGGSSGLFFLDLIKYKLQKLQKLSNLEKIPTTPTTLPNCICVAYYHCDINNNIILEGIGALDIRYRPCTGNLEVCCYLRITPTPPKITTVPMTMPPMTMPPMTKPPMTMPPMTKPPVTMPPMTKPPVTMPPMTKPPMTMPPMTMPPMTMPPATIPPPINCYCVFTWQCDQNGFIIFDGSGINPRQIYAVCPQPIQVCCRANPVIIGPYPIITPYPIINPYPPIDPRPIITLPTLPSVLPTFPTFQPGQTCMCIFIAQCNAFGYIPIYGGGGIIDPRYSISSLRQVGSPCSTTGQMCCRIVFTPPGSQVLPMNAKLRNQLIQSSGTSNACVCVNNLNCPGGNIVTDPRLGNCPVEDEVCCRLNTFLPTTAISTAPDNMCGFISKTFAPAQPFPAAPGKTYFAEFPWMVVLLLRFPGQNDNFLCGASMINSRAILTAAHCVENRTVSDLVARFGEWDTNTTSEPLPFQEAEIQTVIMHPQLYNAALYHDVAILILKTPVTYAVNVMPICLPYQGQAFAPGTRCFATGWGLSAFGAEGQYPPILRKIELPLIDREDCQNRLRQTRLGPYFQLHGSFVCAGGEENRDTCRGDGGGPLVCPISSGQYVQVTFVDNGHTCRQRVKGMWDFDHVTCYRPSYVNQ